MKEVPSIYDKTHFLNLIFFCCCVAYFASLPVEALAQPSTDTTLTFTQQVRQRSIERNPAKQKAYESIIALKSGLLLVKLKTNVKKLAAYRIALENAKGQRRRNQIEGLIEATIQQRDQKNRNIINSFRYRFRFCDVVYFFDTSSTDLKEGRLKRVIADTLLTKIPFSPIAVFYLVAEFGMADSDSYVSHEIAKKGESQIKPQPDPNALGLVVRDEDFVQMPKPFPYFIKEELIVTGKSEERMVEKLDARLFELYRKAMDLK